jgi:hypothetical protein
MRMNEAKETTMEQKLKALCEYSEWAGNPPVLEDAADEIERLRALLAAAHERCAKACEEVNAGNSYKNSPLGCAKAIRELEI